MRNSVADDDAKSTHSPESERKLEKGDSGTTTRAKAMVHHANIGVPPAQFSIQNNQAYCPVCDGGEDDEQQKTCCESGLTDSIRKALL